MQTVLEQGSIDKPLTFDVGLIQLSFIPVCSLNTCNISVKLCRGFALQCFSLLLLKTCYIQVTGDSRRDVLKSMIFCFCIGNTDFHQKLVDIVLLEHIVHINFSAFDTIIQSIVPNSPPGNSLSNLSSRVH